MFLKLCAVNPAIFFLFFCQFVYHINKALYLLNYHYYIVIIMNA